MPLQHLIAIAALVLPAGPLNAAAQAEQNAYAAAIRAFEWKLFQRAEEEFAQFIKHFPDSELAAQAAAFRLRSRAHRLSSQDQHGPAAAAFHKLRIEFPNSPNYLEFIFREAWSEYHQGKREAVIQLLGAEESFQAAAAVRPDDPSVLRFIVSGWLLLAQTHLDQENYAAAKQALEKATDRDIRPEFKWRWQFIRTRLHLAANEIKPALELALPLMRLAEATEKKEWIAESAAVLGEVLIAAGQLEAAIAAYKKNLADGIPQNRRREAWSRIIELRQKQSPNQFLDSLEKFAADAQAASDPALDIPLLALGNQKLRLYYKETGQAEHSETPPPAAAAWLAGALKALERLPREFSESALLNEAYYHLGWCHWERGETEKSVAAFQEAVDRLPEGFEKTIAQFKLADGHYALKQYTPALRRYQKIADSFAPPLQSEEQTFLTQVLYQTIRAAVEAGDEDAAAAAVSRLAVLAPDSLQANKSRLLFGQDMMIRLRKAAEAREIFNQAIQHFPDSPLKAEAAFAVAYSYELAGEWKSAAARYRDWLANYPDHKNRPQAAYAQAWCLGQQGQGEEAAGLFQTFLEQYTEEALANHARLWMGNYHFTRRDFKSAEALYIQAFAPANRAPAPLRCRARLMAGRAAFRQNQFQRAVSHLENLAAHLQKDTSVSPHFRAEAELNLADACFEAGKQLTPPEQTAQIRKARTRYSKARSHLPDSRLAAIAWGRYGDASAFLADYAAAADAYEKVIQHPQADIAMRSQAEVALGKVYERQAETEDKAQRAALLKKALRCYNNVILGANLKDEKTFDMFWLQDAGRKAGRLAAKQKGIDAGIKIYQNLAKIMPSFKPDWDALIQTLEARRSD